MLCLELAALVCCLNSQCISDRRLDLLGITETHFPGTGSELLDNDSLFISCLLPAQQYIEYSQHKNTNESQDPQSCFLEYTALWKWGLEQHPDTDEDIWGVPSEMSEKKYLIGTTLCLTLRYWWKPILLQRMYSSEQLDLGGSVMWSGCQKKEYPTIFCIWFLSMAKGQEAGFAGTGCPVSSRKQPFLQVSITSVWKLQNSKQRIGYSGGASYVETRSFYAVHATPKTRRTSLQVQVSKSTLWQ